MQSFGTGHYIEALLERGVRTLYFNGNQDGVCNWRGTERWLDRLERTGLREFNEVGREDWLVDNKSAGWKRTSPLLSFAYVRGAGHIGSVDAFHIRNDTHRPDVWYAIAHSPRWTNSSRCTPSSSAGWQTKNSEDPVLTTIFYPGSSRHIAPRFPNSRRIPINARAGWLRK